MFNKTAISKELAICSSKQPKLISNLQISSLHPSIKSVDLNKILIKNHNSKIIETFVKCINSIKYIEAINITLYKIATRVY